METTQLEHIFNASFHFENWKDIVKSYFKNTDFYRTPIESIDKSLKYHQVAQSIKEFGSARLADDKIIKFYDIELEDGKHVTKNRVGLRNLIHSEVIPGDVDALLVVFHAPGDKDWRLTFISKSVFWDDDFNENKLETSPRRYTYVLGENESVKTAIQQFEKLEDKQITIKHLIELFNVEKLNKKFFEGYKKQYKKFWSYLLKTEEYKRLFSAQSSEKQEKTIRDFTKKLLGRIVFLHFLQKKGWMGCTPHPKKWENGERQFLLKLLEGYEDKANFHSKCLTQLFFDTLNQPNRANDTFEVAGLSNELNGTKVPYLNGGLFETDTEVNAKNIDFPTSYFEELFDFFGQYNFTIDENSPDDHEVGIDPEMLGHIFENLLEDNKDKGAFYTPKEIVQYMTQESLIQYLQTHLGEHHEIEQFIRHHDKGEEQAKHNFIRDNAERIEDLLDEVKICDPAIGSGAFPMGMLHEIFKAKMALDWTLNRSEVKKNIIQNSIYGVDLESGAVDIARLRFWLALVVDEEEPHALPNLDYKIMQGNSLLESFEGVDLSEIHEGVAIEVDTEKSGANLFSQELQKKKDVDNQEKLEDLIHSYFDLDDPETKKVLHTKIDQQVLNNIYFTLHDHKADLEKEHKKLQRKIKNKSASLRTAEQKIKYETESKDAKLVKKLNTQFEDIADKQLKLKELYHSNERPFFLWRLLFKEVFDKGGFDIVIGNPPYISANNLKKTLGKNKYDYLKSHFITARGTIDIYILFYELGLNILSQRGVLTFINPNRYLSASYAEALRKYIYSNACIKSLADYSNVRVFKEASTYPLVTTLLKDNSEQKSKVKVRSFDKGGSLLSEKKRSSEDLKLLPTFIWGFLLNDKIEVTKKIISQSVPIDRVGKINATSTAKEADEYHEYINEIKGHKLINTGTIDRYTNTWGDEKLTDKGSKYLCPKLDLTGTKISAGRNKLYTNSKIIIAKIALRTEAFYDIDGKYASVNTNCIHSFSDQYTPGYVLCWINSKLYQFMFETFFDGLKMSGGYFLYSAPNILNTYIKEISLDSQQVFINLESYMRLLLESTLFNKNIQYSKEIILELFDEVIDSCIYELYFPEDFKKASIEISKFVEEEFQPIEGMSETEQKDIILKTYQRLTEKKNPLRNQIKLMKIELKQLLLPILSV